MQCKNCKGARRVSKKRSNDIVHDPISSNVTKIEIYFAGISWLELYMACSEETTSMSTLRYTEL